MLLSVRGQKMALLVFTEGVACTVAAKVKEPFVLLAKIELKKCAVRKIKNPEGSAMSLGLLVVRLKYGLFIGHLSQWFAFVMLFNF